MIPVITIVIYFGTQKWDAPLSIHEMFDQTYDKHMMSFVQDYKINLIEPASLSDEDLARFTTDFRQVMEFLKWANDKQKMKKLLSEGSAFENISTSAALLLNNCTNMRIKINQNKETTNMCKAIQEMQQEAVEKAVEKEQKKQQEEVKKTAVDSLLKTARALMANLSLSADRALQATSGDRK